MALNPKTAVAARNLGIDAAFALLDSGKLKGYTTAQPTDADTALGAQTLLFNLALNADSFAAAAAGSAAANSISDDTSADATGTLAWGTLTTSADVRKLDYEAGTSGANLNMNSLAISSGATVSVTSFTITQAA